MFPLGVKTCYKKYAGDEAYELAHATDPNFGFPYEIVKISCNQWFPQKNLDYFALPYGVNFWFPSRLVSDLCQS